MACEKKGKRGTAMWLCEDRASHVEGTASGKGMSWGPSRGQVTREQGESGCR